MKNKIYNMVRRCVARIATGNLGRVQINNDEIICYVVGDKVKVQDKCWRRYHILFESIPSGKKIYKMFDIIKPVHYIVEDVEFDLGVNITTSKEDCHVTFKECTFMSSIEIKVANHLTFINNKFKAQNENVLGSLTNAGEFFIDTYSNRNYVNTIEFINCDMSAYSSRVIPVIGTNNNVFFEDSKKGKIRMYLFAKDIRFTCVEIDNSDNIVINSDSLKVDNSFIHAEDIEVCSGNIKCYNNGITSDVITAINRNYDGELVNIVCNSMFVNDRCVSQTDDKMEKKGVSNRIEAGCLCDRTFEVKRRPLTRVLKRQLED